MKACMTEAFQQHGKEWYIKPFKSVNHAFKQLVAQIVVCPSPPPSSQKILYSKTLLKCRAHLCLEVERGLLFCFGLFYIQNMTANREKMCILNSVYEFSMTYLNNIKKLEGRKFSKQDESCLHWLLRTEKMTKLFEACLFQPVLPRDLTNLHIDFLRPLAPWVFNLCCKCPLAHMCPSQEKGVWEIQTGAHAGLSLYKTGVQQSWISPLIRCSYFKRTVMKRRDLTMSEEVWQAVIAF